MADATLQFLNSLDDPTQWVVRKDVPVFGPHKRPAQKDGSGKVIRPESVVDEARLERIAANVQRLEKERGVLPRITLGHIRLGKDVPEKDQPPVVGFARNTRVGTFGPRQTPCLLVDEYLRKEHASEAGTYPYRSAEFYPTTDEITGVAKLRRDPQLDLGVTFYDRDDSEAYHYAMGAMGMGGMGDDPMGGDPTQPPQANPGSTSNPEELMYEQFCQMMDRYMSEKGLAGAGAGAGQTPPGTPPPAAGARPQGGMVPMSRDSEEALQYRRQLVAVEQELEQLKKDRDGLQLQYARAEADRILVKLEADNYVFRDRERELERFARLDPEARAERELEIRQNWQPAPVGGDRLRPIDQSGSKTSNFTQRDLEHAEQFMREHPGCEWNDAEKYALEQRGK